MKEFFVVDVETGGFEPYPDSGEKHGIIEIAIILVDASFKVVSKFCNKVLLEPGDTVTEGAAAVNGYNAEEWEREAVPLKVMLDEVLPKIKGLHPVGHNVPFDLEFMKDACSRWFVRPTWDYHSINTVAYCLPLLLSGRIENLRLQTVTKFLGIEHTRPHTAFCDAFAALEVLRILAPCFDYSRLP